MFAWSPEVTTPETHLRRLCLRVMGILLPMVLGGALSVTGSPPAPVVTAAPDP